VDTDRGDVKISARASDEAVEGGLSMQEIVSEAAAAAGGEGGGHMGAAGASIPKGSEERFINSVEEIMKTKNREGPESTGKGVSERDESYGTAESEGRAEEGSEAGEGKAGIQGAGSQGTEGEAQAGRRGKKAEGKGLVRYLGS
jgi:hypothetical protein